MLIGMKDLLILVTFSDFTIHEMEPIDDNEP